MEKLSGKMTAILVYTRDSGDRTHSGRGGWSVASMRALERRGLVRLVARHTWNENWELTDAGRETADANIRDKIEKGLRTR